MTQPVRGFSLPFRIDPLTGGVATESGAEKLKENVIHVLLTDLGERVMRREYGGGVRALVHDPNNDALRAIVQRQIAKGIGQNEPRVQVQSVTVSQQGGTLVAELRYLVRESRQLQGVTVPIALGAL
jgi:phage baseplate assembly protein W